MKFHLPIVAIQNEDSMGLLGFADNESATTQYLLLQRTLEPGDQDRALGLNRVHVELNERSAYGIVECAQLEEGRLLLRLHAQTADLISEGESIEVTFDASSDTNKIASQLRLLIGPEFVSL